MDSADFYPPNRLKPRVSALRSISSMRMLVTLAAVGCVALAAALLREGAAPAQTVCGGEIKATVTNGIVRYCGPAIARVSRFPRVTFRGGSCTWSRRPSGFQLLTVYAGSRTLNRRTNGGRAFFNLNAFGSPPHPSGGADILVYAKGKRWTGEARSLRVTATSGRFVAKGLNGSKGWASGTYRC
jgi:hypothetical protein